MYPNSQPIDLNYGPIIEYNANNINKNWQRFNEIELLIVTSLLVID